MRLYRLLSRLALLTLLLSGCAGNPAGGGPSVVFSSRGGEIRVGEEMHQQMVEKGALYDDPALQEYVNKVGRRIAANSDMPDLDFKFHVIDSPDINAFALPGGYIYVNRGLLAYLSDEGQLAGVLGHEIGHITARHHARRKTASVTNTAMAVTVLILTGSGDLAEVSSMYGAELLSGYGREMELEADRLGAAYLYKSGYDPESLLEVIGVLKDHERYQRLRANASGRALATYHGLFATHPRNDKRLKTVIDAASQLDLDTYIEDPSTPGEFKQRTNGMVWGPSIQGERADNRFYHEKLDFTFEVPEGWVVETGAKAIVVRSRDDTAKLTLSLRKRDRDASPRATLEGSSRGKLEDGKKLELDGLAGYTATASSGGAKKRLAVIDYGNLTYQFEGEAQDLDTDDAKMLTILESFRAIDDGEKNVGPGNFLHYVQLRRGESLATLAADAPIDDAENQLRLINGFYPAGEPRTGDWVKTIR
ncbi:MAG: M48 family metalloprotease [Halioglobus sp.]|nr:M48 family metalloprotease [Halioglobus sp.]